MCATHTNIIRIADRNLPPCRHLRRLVAILNKRAIIDLVTMQRHVQVGAIALREGGGVGSSMRVFRGERLQVHSWRRCLQPLGPVEQQEQEQEQGQEQF